jgi:hypothetical protein
MSRDDNVVGGEMKTPVTFVVSGVFEENTSSGPRSFGGEIRIAGTSKHA